MRITNDKEEIKKLINNDDMVLIYFSGENCGVCNVIKEKVKDILKKYPNINSIEVKTEKSLEVASEYSIFTIPGILVYVDHKETIREARYISVEELEKKIDRYYNMIF